MSLAGRENFRQEKQNNHIWCSKNTVLHTRLSTRKENGNQENSRRGIVQSHRATGRGGDAVAIDLIVFISQRLPDRSLFSSSWDPQLLELRRHLNWRYLCINWVLGFTKKPIAVGIGFVPKKLTSIKSNILSNFLAKFRSAEEFCQAIFHCIKHTRAYLHQSTQVFMDQSLKALKIG